LKKNDLIQYVLGVYNDSSKVSPKVSPKINICLNEIHPVFVESHDWLKHLHTDGYTVVKLENWNDNYTNMFFSWFESCCANFNKNDHTTWISQNMPRMPYGILKNYFGHTELQWQIRELCVPIFSLIWNVKPEDLLCSFDGGCFLPCTSKDNFKQWIHVDQDRNTKGFSCVQGIVNFEENGPEDGGLILVEDSKSIFETYMDKHPSEGIVWGPADMTDSLLSSRRLIKICAPKGSLILFDSRMFHCNINPNGSVLRENGKPRFRMCTYVSMQPRINATPKELQKRIKLYENGRMTGHWCYGHYFKETSEHPHTYGKIVINKPPSIEIARLTPLRKSLIGY
jgi:hypothetical protein